jgi:hypothetical protein
MSNTVKYEMDLTNPPPLTHTQKAELLALANRPDSEIDYSDIPPLTEEFWKNAVRGNPFLQPKIYLEPQICDFLNRRAKAKGVSFNDLLNTLLRKDMELIEAA